MYNVAIHICSIWVEDRPAMRGVIKQMKGEYVFCECLLITMLSNGFDNIIVYAICILCEKRYEKFM